MAKLRSGDVAVGPFDVADYLRDENDMALYLEAILEGDGADDPRLLAAALGDIARAKRRMGELAQHVGVTREGLYKALSGRGNPSFSTVVKAARGLGVEIHFRPMGRKRQAIRAARKPPRVAGRRESRQRV